MSDVSVRQAVYRLRRVAPRRLPLLVGRYAWRAARGRARRWQLARSRGELSDTALRRALGAISPDEVFDGFLRRFFVDPERRNEIAIHLQRAHPEHARRTHRAAEQVVGHIFDLLGSGPVNLGPRIDWQRDFTSGYTWSAELLSDDQDTLLL